MAIRTNSNRLKSASGARPIMRVLKGKNREHLRFDTPESIIHVPNTKELNASLEFYGRTPFLKQMLPTVIMRRQYAEKVRPALRWYCQHFGVPIPKWLEGTPGVDEDFTPEDLADLYGPEPLNVVEFRRHGQEQVQEAGEDAGEEEDA